MATECHRPGFPAHLWCLRFWFLEVLHGAGSDCQAVGPIGTVQPRMKIFSTHWVAGFCLEAILAMFEDCLRIVWALRQTALPTSSYIAAFHANPPERSKKNLPESSSKCQLPSQRNVRYQSSHGLGVGCCEVRIGWSLWGIPYTATHIFGLSIGSWVFQMPCNKQHCQKRRTSQCRLGFNTVSSKGAKPSSEELVGKPQFTRFTTRFSHGFPMEVGDQATWWWRWAVPSPMDTSHPALPPQLHDHHRDVDARNHLCKMWSSCHI